MPSQLKYHPPPKRHHNLQYLKAALNDLLIYLYPFSAHHEFCLLPATFCPLFQIMHHKPPDTIHCPSNSGQTQLHHSSFSTHKTSRQLAAYPLMPQMHKSKAYMLPNHPYWDSPTDIQNISRIIPRIFLKVHYPLMPSYMLRYYSIITVL